MRVCVADDHDAVREALRELLADVPGVEALVEGKTSHDAVAAARAGEVDIVLMDVNMPGGDGVAATRRIREELPHIRVVALTAAHDPESVAAMIAAGADSYLVKTALAEELRESLTRIFAGEIVLAPPVLPVVVGDLAERLRAEQERVDALVALDRTKREFIALVSDQLRTPLTAISGYVKTLRGGWERLGEDMKAEFLERIDEQAEHLERRIDRILTVARLETGVDRGSGTMFALDGIATEVVDRSDPPPERTVETALERVEVLGDRRAMSEAVFALVDNALVHGRGRVAVRVRRSGTEAVLEVSDEGPGIAQEDLAAILAEPFMPGDTSDRRPSGGGLGLSLYVARRVVEDAGGRLELVSAVGGGTRARIALPALPAGDPAAGA